MCILLGNESKESREFNTRGYLCHVSGSSLSKLICVKSNLLVQIIPHSPIIIFD